MFEYDQKIVNSLLNENNDFKRLFEKHNILKSTIKDANEKNIKVNRFSLEGLKKEKLFLKDKMSIMIENYKQNIA